MGAIDHSGDAHLLQQEEELDAMRDLFERAPCGYHCLDPSGVFVRVNATVARWLGLPVSELVGRVRFVDVLTADSAELYEGRMGEGRDRLPVTDLALELRGPSATTKRVLLSSNAVCDGRGALKILRAVMVDRSPPARTSGVMARPTPPPPSPEAAADAEALRLIDARAQRLDAAISYALGKQSYVEGEVFGGPALTASIAELRETLVQIQALAREIGALGRSKIVGR